MQEENVAILGNEGGFTLFSYGGQTIRFRTSNHLERYTQIKEWDHGYLVVMAKYDNKSADEEEYIDLVPILENLYMDTAEFLQGIEEVRI